MSEEKCCRLGDLPLDQTYWDNQYQANATGWDLDKCHHQLKPISILIENKEKFTPVVAIPTAEHLVQQGFTNVEAAHENAQRHRQLSCHGRRISG
jgi:hypothetical protein